MGLQAKTPWEARFMNMVFFEIGAEDQEMCAVACAGLRQRHDVLCTPTALTQKTALPHVQAVVISTFVHSRLDAQVLELLPGLRLIASRSTGFDHIDLDYCRSHSIAVCNVPDYGAATIAEHAFALLLALCRRIPTATERTRRGDFSLDGLRGFELYGKTLGVLGTGRIGRRAIAIGLGLGMEVMAYDLYPKTETAAALGFSYAALDEVLAQADVITIHLPATPQTRHLIAEPQFAIMKKGAVLINTARGSIVDAEALIRALDQGIIAAAGLDVLPEEKLLRDESVLFQQESKPAVDELRALLADHVLLQHPNVLVTPHSAFNTHEAMARIMTTTVGNILAFAQGKPQNVVTGR